MGVYHERLYSRGFPRHHSIVGFGGRIDVKIWMNPDESAVRPRAVGCRDAAGRGRSGAAPAKQDESGGGCFSGAAASGEPQ